MQTIDADAHVIETEHTWDYLEPGDQKYRPLLVGPDSERQSWLIDGQIRGFRFPTLSEQTLADASRRTGRNLETPREAREMEDIELRLHHMDQLGIDVQVLHNTIFIKQLTDQPAIDVALCRSWNRWLADIWKQGHGRLRWSMVPPLLSLPDALDEIRFSKEHGAVAVLMRPIEGNRPLADPSFYPIYEEAQRLDMAIAVHIANANPWLCNMWQNDPAFTFAQFRVPTMQACYSLMMSEIPQVFPRLRWSFIEASAQWLPWVIREVRSRYKTTSREIPENIMRDYRIYVTCQNDDDIDWVLRYAGEHNLVIGTDYGHFDPSTEIDAINLLRNTESLSPASVENILSTNPKALYAI